MKEKQHFLDNEGLTYFYGKLKADIKTDIDNEVISHASGFVSYTDDTTYEALEGTV